MAKTAFQILNARAQACIAASPVIILGSGASIAAGVPGMGDLRNHLLTLPDPAGYSGRELEPWHTRIRIAEPENKPDSATVAFWDRWSSSQQVNSIASAVDSWRRQSIQSDSLPSHRLGAARPEP